VRIGKEGVKNIFTYNRKKNSSFEKKRRKPRTRDKSQEERICCRFLFILIKVRVRLTFN